jgi:hypothetical protein
MTVFLDSATAKLLSLAPTDKGNRESETRQQHCPNDDIGELLSIKKFQH